VRLTSISVVAFAGVLSQLSGIVLLAILFASLRTHARRTSYFRYWNRAWLAVMIAVAAIAIRYSPLVSFGGVPFASKMDWSPDVRALYVVYLAGKMLYFSLLAVGAHVYVRGREALPRMRFVIGGGLLYTAAAVAASDGLNTLMVWQSVIAAPALAYCWILLHRLPRPRRSWGSISLGAVFGGLAVLWTLYAIGFGYRLWDPAPAHNPLRLLLGFNSYADSVFQMLLGSGMVFLLMEDANRSLVDAHAELAAAHDRLRRTTLFDPLTGALNRRAFAERLGLERVFASYGAVAVIDVDALKPVNDRYGHGAGDALLCHLVAVIAPGLRATDKLFRWGGDEFLVVLPAASPHDATWRLNAILENAPPLVYDGSTVPITASFGTAAYVSAEDLDDAVRRADAVMYASKAMRKRGTDGRRTPAAQRASA
jgi:diguanylate cyclase (GGDEF)-like protein